MTKDSKNWISPNKSPTTDCGFNRMLASTVRYTNAMQLTYWRITFCKSTRRYQVVRSPRTVVTFLVCTALALSYAAQLGYSRMAKDGFRTSAILVHGVQHCWWILFHVIAFAGVCKNSEALTGLLTIGERLESRLDIQMSEQQSLFSKFVFGQKTLISFLAVGFYAIFYSGTKLRDFYYSDTGILALNIFSDVCLFCSNAQDIGLRGVTLSVCYLAWYQINVCKVAMASSPTGSIDILLDTVDDLRKILDHLNSVFGFVILSSTMGMIPFFSVNLPRILNGDLHLMTIYCMYALIFCVIAFVCGSTHSAMSEMPEILKERLKSGIYVSEMASQRLQITLQQLQSGVGIKAKVFVITWSWIGQVAGAVITFAMILVQIQS